MLSKNDRNEGDALVPLAHVRENENGLWEKQTLIGHLEAVSRLAADFAGAFASEDWGRITGRLHDLGKASPAWQKHLKDDSGYEPELAQKLDGDGGSVPQHSIAGAVAAVCDFRSREDPMDVPAACAWALAYAIAGHHAGLADWDGDGRSALVSRFQEAYETKVVGGIGQCLGEGDSQINFNPLMLHCQPPLPKSFLGLTTENYLNESENFHLWVRMLFSCLIDADFLDTESFMTPERAQDRGGYATLAELEKAFGLFMKKLSASAADTPVNRCRQNVLNDCLAAAEQEPGFFSLTVPTGGGKTFASFAFALKHALRWGKKRVIIAIPYTSIIEQTAADLKKALGSELAESVLEHHSNLDPQEETRRLALASENWESPVVVTTNVQLFESLLGSKTSRCRKLHHVAGSVIVLDEAQMLPLPHLRPVLSVLKSLVRHFGVTVLLCTATQPALSGRFAEGRNAFDGLPEPREIVGDVPKLFSVLKRVERVSRYDLAKPVGWPDLARDLAAEPRALAVVNRRRDCRALYDELDKLAPENLFHLSACMCAEHRSDKIALIKSRLKGTKEPVRVISTQLIEAGVNLDFPAVYRAACGLDSAVQAAGRCNREGLLAEPGHLYLFMPEKPSPRGLLLKGEETLKSMLMDDKNLDIFDRDVISRYFRRYYADVNSFDGAGFRERLLDGAPEFKFWFRTFDRKFRLIDEENQISVFVAYQNEETGADSQALIDRLLKSGPERALMRRLQRYSVNISLNDAGALLQKGVIAATPREGFYYQTLPELYSPKFGLNLDFAADNAANVFIGL